MSESPAERPSVEQDAAPQPHPWTELAPEHFELLRLAPLPIDRHTGARPLRFVVERQGTELFARLPVREGVAAGCRAPPADASNSFGC